MSSIKDLTGADSATPLSTVCGGSSRIPRVLECPGGIGKGAALESILISFLITHGSVPAHSTVLPEATFQVKPFVLGYLSQGLHLGDQMRTEMSRYHPESNKRTGRCWVQALCCLSLCGSYPSLDSSPLSPPESMGHWMTRSRPLPAGSCLGRSLVSALPQLSAAQLWQQGPRSLPILVIARAQGETGRFLLERSRRRTMGPG